MKVTARSTLALSAALLLGWSATLAAAPGRVGEIATRTVKFADLDIASAAGAQALYERIVAAARSVCRDTDSRLVRDCRANAVANAVKGVGSPLLSAAHRSSIERVEEVVSR